MGTETEQVFVALKRRGLKPELAFKVMREAGYSFFQAQRAICSLFELDLDQAKDVIVRATGAASSLPEYQAKLAEELLAPDEEQPTH